MSGIVGVIANDSARYTLFWTCLDTLELPHGWRKEKLIGGDWCGARNALCQMTLDSDAEWLFFMDDDHAFAPNVLNQLLSHDKKVIVPVCTTRSAPFPPVAFTERVDDSRYLPIYLPGQEDSGLVEIVAAGTAGMLIHRSVLIAVGGPRWFEYDAASEDLLFCNKAKEEGFDIHVDLSVKIGHITHAVMWPTVHDGEWCVGATIGSYGASTNVLLPIEYGEASTASEKVEA